MRLLKIELPEIFWTMIGVDTNILLLYLLCPVDRNNPKWQVEKAQLLIRQASKVLILDVVIAEAEWVLESVSLSSSANPYTDLNIRHQLEISV